jgi:hypothetical protein
LNSCAENKKDANQMSTIIVVHRKNIWKFGNAHHVHLTTMFASFGTVSEVFVEDGMRQF